MHFCHTEECITSFCIFAALVYAFLQSNSSQPNWLSPPPPPSDPQAPGRPCSTRPHTQAWQYLPPACETARTVQPICVAQPRQR